MAELIVRFVPSIQKVRMCNSGTEATMSAVRLARGFTKRDKIIKFAGCYHGHSDSLLIKAGSGALTHGHPDSAGVPAAFAQETIVAAVQRRRGARGRLRRQSRARSPASSSSPTRPTSASSCPSRATCPISRQLCTAHGAVLIFDEVMTGFRLARGGVQELEKITPDLTTLGKIIGGGLPVGAFGGRADIMDRLAPLGPVYQAGTLSGNPLAMAAGIAALRLLEETNPYARLDALGRQVRAALLAAARAQGPGRAGAPGRLHVRHVLHPRAGARLRHRPAEATPNSSRGSSTPASTAASTCRPAPTRRRFSARRTKAQPSTGPARS